MRDYKPQSQKNAVERALQSFAQTPFGNKLFLHVFPTVDRALVPLTRGKLSSGAGQPIVLLHSRGAKSGIERVNPLLATKKGDLLLVVASKGGAPEHPSWLYNVRANPDVEVTMDGARVPMRASVPDGAERDRLWAMVCDNYSGYVAYQQRAGDRLIPVVSLTPR